MKTTCPNHSTMEPCGTCGGSRTPNPLKAFGLKPNVYSNSTTQAYFGHRSRSCTYGVSYVTELQSAPFATWVPCDKRKGVMPLFPYVVRYAMRSVYGFWYCIGSRLLSTQTTIPPSGRSAKYRLQTANLCFGVLYHQPIAQIGTLA